MWPRQYHERELRSLLAGIETAQRIDADLLKGILERACPRLGTSPAPEGRIGRLIQAEAWVELGLWLIGWELPDWAVHRLIRDEAGWCCSIGVGGIAMNWLEDIVEFQHDSLPLAVLGALVQAQLRKAQGVAPSNVTAFRRPALARPARRAGRSISDEHMT